jgi:hypothetical protein
MSPVRKMALAAALPALAACSTGKGVGAASGALFEYGCTGSGDYSADGVSGSQDIPAPFDLDPSYFAGEPIDDLRNYGAGSGIMSNRLIIRLQRSGKQIELNDVLTFDVLSAYEVARCVRGRFDVEKNVNDWDETNCYRASDAGPGRIRIQHDSRVHASLILKATCTADLVASAVSSPVPASYAATVGVPTPPAEWISWVEFEEFGSATQNDRPPTERDPVEGRFRVDFGQRIYATEFLLTLVDDTIVNAAINNRSRPHAQIGGTLGGDATTGRFDFDLVRGQGAQFFP